MIPTERDVQAAQAKYEKADAEWMLELRSEFGQDAWTVRVGMLGQGAPHTELRRLADAKKAAEVQYLRVWTAYCGGQELAA